MAAKTVLASSLLFVTKVLGHSWLHCSSYLADIEGQDFSDDNCVGYIRNWASTWNSPSFAADLGVNYFGADGAWCQESLTTPIADMYSDDYPAAEWYVGNTYRLVWPAKNHANYECFDNIPDTSMKLYYMASPDQTADGSSLPGDWTVLYDFQTNCVAGEDGCGFQNCPKFCENTDGAPCYGDYTVDSSMFSSDGYYSIMWYWIFNSGSAPYTTCFEVYVHTDGGDDVSSDDGGGVEPEATNESEEESSDGGSSGTDYVVQIPICYTGADYDKDTLEDGADSHFDEEDGVSFTVISVTEGTSAFNATIQTHTDDSIYVSDTARDDQPICDSIETAFTSGDCYVCDEGAIVVYSQGSSSGGGSSSSDADAAVVILWSVVLTIVILLLIFGICHFLQTKNYIVCTENSIVWQGSNGAAATNAPRPSGSTTTGAAAGGTRHVRAVPSASALATHDIQSHQVVAAQSRPSGPPPVPTH